MASVEVLAGPERRRRWSVEQKQAIVEASFGLGAVVRDVARQADALVQLVFAQSPAPPLPTAWKPLGCRSAPCQLVFDGYSRPILCISERFSGVR
jgi:transposase